jgi:hypothetical protein
MFPCTGRDGLGDARPTSTQGIVQNLFNVRLGSNGCGPYANPSIPFSHSLSRTPIELYRDTIEVVRCRADDGI